MPTPLVHLYIAQQIIECSDSLLAGCLQQQAGDFMLGSIAPDAWWLGDLSRVDAHVLPIPMPRDASSVVELLHAYPVLRHARALQAPQVAFVAGYLTHLLLDELWYHDIFDPYFLSGPTDLPVQQRLVLHNVLRLFLEDTLEARVPPDCIQFLSAPQIDYRLPPIPDSTLTILRDMVVDELSPGGQSRSADVFAEQMGMPVGDLLAILRSPGRMEEEVFCRLPAGLLDHVMGEGVRVGIDVLDVYLNGDAHEDMMQAIADSLRTGWHV